MPMTSGPTRRHHTSPAGAGTANSTARDVLAGLDLRGRTAILTGGYSGLGLELTRAMSEAGASVVVPARRPHRAEDALAGLTGVEIVSVDLGDLESVHRFADRFLESGRPIHLLVANAAVMAAPEVRVGPGWESQFAINHLGHFVLVNRLWPALTAGGARVVVVVSGVSTINWDDIQAHRRYDKWGAYLQSKTANRLFALQLDQLGAGAGVRAFTVAPGFILTPLQRHLTREEMVAAGWVDNTGAVINDAFVSPAVGASTIAWAAVSPDLDGRGALHCENNAVIGSIAATVDPADAPRLWDYSARITGADLRSTFAR